MPDGIAVDSLLAGVKEIASTIREHAAAAEDARRLTRPTVAAMIEAGLYNMARPKAHGGLETDPITMFRVVEEVARHDGSAAWNLQLSVSVHFLLAWLPDDGAAEIVRSDPNTIMATSLTPGRRAVSVDGGYRLRGQWPFVSGSHDAHWFSFVPQIMDGDRPLLNEEGMPVQRMMFIAAKNVRILDTWHTLGLRGTGSDDVVVSDHFVPERHSALMAPLEKPGTAYRGPLYRLTIWVPIGLLAAPALGIARAAIDGIIELAEAKTPAFTGSALRTRQVVQRQVAEAEATLGAGRAYLHETFQESWEAAQRGEPITLHQKLKMQLATTHAAACAAKAVDLVYGAAGTSSIRNEQMFQKYFRDVHTATQHAFSSASRYESVGAMMLGAESDWGFFGL